jgi:bacterioferritin (cytochrome b1)
VSDKQVLVMSFYRDAELQGARLLFSLHRLLRDADSQLKLSRHLSDETRHAWLWTKRIVELGGVPIAVADGYQRRLGLRVGAPRDVLDLLALTLIAESRALERYRSHAALPAVDQGTLEVLAAVTGDEEWHLKWVQQKMREIAEERGDEQRAAEILARYRAIEREVYATFAADEAELLHG